MFATGTLTTTVISVLIGIDVGSMLSSGLSLTEMLTVSELIPTIARQSVAAVLIFVALVPSTMATRQLLRAASVSNSETIYTLAISKMPSTIRNISGEITANSTS